MLRVTHWNSSFLLTVGRSLSGLESSVGSPSLCLSLHFSPFTFTPTVSLKSWSELPFEGVDGWFSLPTLGPRGKERGLFRGGGDPLPSLFSLLRSLGVDCLFTKSNCWGGLELTSTLCCLFNPFFVRLSLQKNMLEKNLLTCPNKIKI